MVIPVLLGADMNCYGKARAFHEAYGVISYVFGKSELGAIKYSNIIRFQKIPSLESGDEVLKILIDFASHAAEKPYIFGCTDEYAVFISKNKKTLSDHYICKCPDPEISEKYSEKDEFYKKCAELSIPYPEYVCFDGAKTINTADMRTIGCPAIIKPSCSYRYWHHPFPDMKKVYSAADESEAESIVNKIYLSGYDGKIIFQKKVRPHSEYVITCYSEHGSVKAACVGRVLLGEVTPKGLGNHVAILTEQNDILAGYAAEFLESIGYDGLSNFDAIQEESTGKYYLLEMNLRQGRSNYYMTASGMNIAKLVVEGGCFSRQKSIYWHSVPQSIVMKRISDTDRSVISRLTKSKSTYSTFFYPHDLRNPLRSAYLATHYLGFFGKYKKSEKI